MSCTIIIIHEQLEAAYCFHSCYTMTVINKLDSYAVPPLKRAVKGDVPVPELPIVLLQGRYEQRTADVVSTQSLFVWATRHQ